jgi:acetyl-CoA synthetase
MKPAWIPAQETIQNSNIFQMMQEKGFDNYRDFWKWSVTNKEVFWEDTVNRLGIVQKERFTSMLDTSAGVEQAHWLKNAKLNIVDSCFQNDPQATAITFKEEGEPIQKISQSTLLTLVNKIANGLMDLGLKRNDNIAIDLPMTVEAVAIYLAAIKAGMTVVTIADSFSAKEIAIRLKITKPKLIFTQDYLQRAGKELPHYDKVVEAVPPKAVIIKVSEKNIQIRKGDIFWETFLSATEQFESVVQDPEAIITILFSSGTTGEPKAIPWTQTTPIKGASDAYYHHDIHKNDVLCWPTNLGWMMGPWLVFSALINKATIALYYGVPIEDGFGDFIQKAKVTMLGVIPSFVRTWKNSGAMEGFDWSRIKCFSSTGEVSNPSDMNYLMKLADNKPVIEYCGGTEVGGGYIASTLVQKNLASTFSTQTLGGQFVLLDAQNKPSTSGEVFLIPPIMGLSTALLNRDHHEVYYKNTPTFKGLLLRRHGDELAELENGYYKALGRVDDAMNLGGIKVSSVQIETLLNSLSFIKESACIAVSPKDGGPAALVIYYVENASDLTDESRLNKSKNIIREQLNPLFKVSDLVKISKLPRTASNKVMRRKLRAQYSDGMRTDKS